eukprot:c11089_g1_i2.p1 GENE.c11089_g1_i2~~c11089_g1_i2.p1  ORF type:complete len:289 (-),score=66.86 c11089_g1_i2:41-850(-)
MCFRTSILLFALFASTPMIQQHNNRNKRSVSSFVQAHNKDSNTIKKYDKTTQKGTCDFQTCHSCIPVNNCGWCSTTNTCMSGQGSGATSDSCNTNAWFYYTCPSSLCSSFPTCSLCTSQPSCGWCANTQTCMPGQHFGPINASCSARQWNWYPSSCQLNSTCTLSCSVETAAYTSCRGGIAVKRTGKWCNSNGREYCCENCCILTTWMFAVIMVAPLLVILVAVRCLWKLNKRNSKIPVAITAAIATPSTVDATGTDENMTLAIATPIL